MPKEHIGDCNKQCKKNLSAIMSLRKNGYKIQMNDFYGSMCCKSIETLSDNLIYFFKLQSLTWINYLSIRVGKSPNS